MKGQITIEFMISIGMAIIFFALIINATYLNQRQNTQLKLRYEAESTLERISHEINSVIACGHNCSRTFYVPASVGDAVECSLTLHPRSILLNASGRYFSRSIHSSNTGSVRQLSSGAKKVSVREGVLEVEDV